MMGLESRLGSVIREDGERVVAALDHHGAKLEESGADHRRANIAMAAALEHQVLQKDTLSTIVGHLVNATMFQVDIRPLIRGLEEVVRKLGRRLGKLQTRRRRR